MINYQVEPWRLGGLPFFTTDWQEGPESLPLCSQLFGNHMVPTGQVQWIWMVTLWNFASIQVLPHMYQSHLLPWLSLLLTGKPSLLPLLAGDILFDLLLFKNAS